MLNTPDVLLERGIGEYTFIPGPEEGVLGKGKFSVVYKVVGPDGQHVCPFLYLIPSVPKSIEVDNR